MKNSEKISGVPLDRINKLREFQEFAFKPSQIKK